MFLRLSIERAEYHTCNSVNATRPTALPDLTTPFDQPGGFVTKIVASWKPNVPAAIELMYAEGSANGGVIYASAAPVPEAGKFIASDRANSGQGR